MLIRYSCWQIDGWLASDLDSPFRMKVLHAKPETGTAIRIYDYPYLRKLQAADDLQIEHTRPQYAVPGVVTCPRVPLLLSLAPSLLAAPGQLNLPPSIFIINAPHLQHSGRLFDHTTARMLAYLVHQPLSSVALND